MLVLSNKTFRFLQREERPLLHEKPIHLITTIPTTVPRPAVIDSAIKNYPFFSCEWIEKEKTKRCLLALDDTDLMYKIFSGDIDITQDARPFRVKEREGIVASNLLKMSFLLVTDYDEANDVLIGWLDNIEPY